MNCFLSYFVYNLVRAVNGRPDIPTARLIMYVHTSIPGELENTVRAKTEYIEDVLYCSFLAK